MAIHIKGINLPKVPNSYGCLNIQVWPDGQANLWKVKGLELEAIRVPKHGDLIDKRELEHIVGEPLEEFLSRLGFRCPETIIPAED